MTYHYNMNFLAWYFTKDLKDKEYAFQILTMASMEEPYCFMRILLYIANTRISDEKYHTILHFMCVMYPEWIMSNLDLITSIGDKSDVIYVINSKILTERATTWIKHKSKTDDYYKEMLSKVLNDKTDTKYIVNKTRKMVVLYKPKFGKKYKWSVFLEKILSDSTFNGITI